MTSESRSENGATVTSSYIYDALGQLVNFTRSDGQSESYAYDAVGNMLTKTQNGVKTAMRYNAANQLVQSVKGGETTTYSYDANGNLVKSENAAGARSYAYNARNLLAKYTDSTGYSEAYTYNANRLLSSITNNTGTTSLTWDILYGDGVVIQSAQNGESTCFIYGLERISAISGNTRTEYLHDGRGSVAAELIYNGTSLTETITKTYSPFGEQLSEAVSGFGYNGEYYNAATGMIYLRARFYAPEMNRFSQKDLLRGSVFAPKSLNRYCYCQNDPVDFADYNGRQMCAACVYDGGSGKVQNAQNTVYANTGTSTESARAISAAIAARITNSITSAQPYSFDTISSEKNTPNPPSKKQSSTQLILDLPAIVSVVGDVTSCVREKVESLWSKLRFRGEIHAAVQAHLVTKYGFIPERKFEIDIVGADGKITTKTYRLDLYDMATNEYWEVKPASYSTPGTYKYKMLQKQLKTYDQFAARGFPLGEGEFNYSKYIVTWISEEPGIVFYDFYRKDAEENTAVMRRPAEKQEENTSSNRSGKIIDIPSPGGVAAINDYVAGGMTVAAIFFASTLVAKCGGGGGRDRECFAAE